MQTWPYWLALFLLGRGGLTYCPASQRFDASSFPPRCIDCPKVVSNPIALALINASAIRSRYVQKFSPGLPQNKTCGCWRVNRTVNLEFNASWIVSAITFRSSATHWLRSISIAASDDNRTFMDWGDFDFNNHTSSSIALFTYPIRARYFRVAIHRYVNHHINESGGFPISAGALVSNTQPFGCECPMLSTGECCPFVNMTVRNDTCGWCMDPASINTVMVKGCGQCKAGTFEHMGRCILQRPVDPARNSLRLTDPRSDGMFWIANLNLTLDGYSEVRLYLSATASSCDTGCIGPIFTQLAGSRDPSSMSEQYVQFDRGRYWLNMTRDAFRSWTNCSTNDVCTGRVIARFNQTDTRIQWHSQAMQLVIRTPVLVSEFAGCSNLRRARIEIHRLRSGQWAVRALGFQPRSNESLRTVWGGSLEIECWNASDSFFILSNPPPTRWDSVSLTDGVNTVTAYPPMNIVRHTNDQVVTHTGVDVLITYGLGFSPQPSPGDSEQIIFISAKSPQPIRLKRLSTSFSDSGPNILYTNSKGFIADPARVLDLLIACSYPAAALQQWMAQALSLLPTPQLTQFMQASCSIAATSSRAYWMLPVRSTAQRRWKDRIRVLVEFA